MSQQSNNSPISLAFDAVEYERFARYFSALAEAGGDRSLALQAWRLVHTTKVKQLDAELAAAKAKAEAKDKE